jgi:hypothetical protein
VKKPVQPEREHPTRDKSLLGAAGVHYVVSELCLRGLVALPTVRNTAGVDVVVVDQERSWHADLQVKTSRSKVTFWPVSTRYESWRGPGRYYVFLRFDARAGRFDAFLEGADRVVENARAGRENDKRRGVRPWAPAFQLKDQVDRLRDQWERFGPETAP